MPLTRERAIARLVEAEADIRALGVARLALCGSVLAQDAMACHVRGLLKNGEDIPGDPCVHEQPITEELKVSV